MHNDDVQRNDKRDKQGDNVIQFSTKRNRDIKDWKFTFIAYKIKDEDRYEFNITQPEEDQLDDLSLADILARAAFQIAPEEFSEEQEVCFKPDFEADLDDGNDGWVDDDEDLLSYVMKGNKELKDD